MPWPFPGLQLPLVSWILETGSRVAVLNFDFAPRRDLWLSPCRGGTGLLSNPSVCGAAPTCRGVHPKCQQGHGCRPPSKGSLSSGSDLSGQALHRPPAGRWPHAGSCSGLPGSGHYALSTVQEHPTSATAQSYGAPASASTVLWSPGTLPGGFHPH